MASSAKLGIERGPEWHLDTKLCSLFIINDVVTYAQSPSLLHSTSVYHTEFALIPNCAALIPNAGKSLIPD